MNTETKKFWEKVLEEFTKSSSNTPFLCQRSNTFRKEWERDPFIFYKYGIDFLNENADLKHLWFVGELFLFTPSRNQDEFDASRKEIRIQFIRWMIKQTSNDTTI